MNTLTIAVNTDLDRELLNKYLKFYLKIMIKKLTVIILFILVVSVHRTEAKNHVKIATIGAASPIVDTNKSSQELVDEILEFWRYEFAQVLSDHPDLIVLPEVCTQPRRMDIETSEKYYAARGNQINEYFASVAKENHCYIAYGDIRTDENNYSRNSGVLLDRQGEIAGVYDKNFPTIGEMKKGRVPSNKAPVFETDFGRLAFAICFDLNFDELKKRYAAQNPDIIVFLSMYHGGLEQAHWAYTNRSYFVGAVGVSNLPSEIRNPMGDVVATSSNHFHYIVSTVNLDFCHAHLDNNKRQLKELKRKYQNDVVIYDPSEIGAVLITSESDKVTAEEMMQEFDITPLNEYLNNSREYRLKPGIIK